eukprot:CAMPEP_0197459140 /NCGR_PEP_ID=MMETSP1175-20131217/50563_1 /TAXON_ID=1003142 /ORGANISM="Triceratium dubium, Strain CCMP147" /LENGTH=101 /DNA_ID=CAMNT_0042993929 /DNA_START=439 /DNA_END=744 /DNA_ORIENTATION=+
MPHAVLTTRVNGCTTRVSSFTLSAPEELKSRIKNAMEHHAGCSFYEADSSGTGSAFSSISGLQHHTLLNWVEASAWTLEHMSFSGDSRNSHEFTQYIFKRD